MDDAHISADSASPNPHPVDHEARSRVPLAGTSRSVMQVLLVAAVCALVLAVGAMVVQRSNSSTALQAAAQAGAKGEDASPSGSAMAPIGTTPGTVVTPSETTTTAPPEGDHLEPAVTTTDSSVVTTTSSEPTTNAQPSPSDPVAENAKCINRSQWKNVYPPAPGGEAAAAFAVGEFMSSSAAIEAFDRGLCIRGIGPLFDSQSGSWGVEIAVLDIQPWMAPWLKERLSVDGAIHLTTDVPRQDLAGAP